MKYKTTIACFIIILIAIATYFYISKKENVKEGILIENQITEINKDLSFKYNFSKKPKIGSIVLKISLENKKSDNIKIIGSYGMPSMPGSHDSGDKEFYVNNKGDFLLPIDFVMPGEWKINLIIKSNNKEIYNGDIFINI